MCSYTEGNVDHFLESDEYYEMIATPLKPASIIKQEHRQELLELLNPHDLKAKMNGARKLIREHLAATSSPEELLRIEEEMDYFMHFINHSKEGCSCSIIYKQSFDIPSDILLQIYRLACQFIENKQYENARLLFTFLTSITPAVSDFWIAFGVCLQAMEFHEGAILLFANAKTLTPSNPAPYIYTAESYIKLQDRAHAQEEFDLIMSLLQEGRESDEDNWKDALAFVKKTLQSENSSKF